jgi:hypothetical protein
MMNQIASSLPGGDGLIDPSVDQSISELVEKI